MIYVCTYACSLDLSRVFPQRFCPYICFYVCITYLIGWHKPWNGLAHNTWGINVFIMQIDYVKISCKEDVHICCTNFAKEMKQNLHETTCRRKTYGKQPRTLKFEMELNSKPSPRALINFGKFFN
jgi:hypothetical protein